jgi:hypothetical protein
MRRHLLPLSCLLAIALAAPAAGQDRLPANERPATCPVGGPLQVWLLLQSSATDCDATVSGTVDALCCCVNNSWAACASGGGGGSGTVTSIALAVPAEWSVSGSPVTTAGTITIAEATQTANTVYAGPTSGGAAAPGFRVLVDGDVPDAVTIGGYTATKCARFNGSGVLVAASGDCSAGDTDANTQVIFDIGDDGGNDSTALLELSTLNDDYGALTEPSADEAQIDFAKIPPYQQYDADRPPSSCAVCDEFTAGPSLSWDTTNGMDGGSVTAEFGAYVLAHPSGTHETGGIWTASPSSGNTDFTVTAKILQWGAASTDGCGVGFIAAGSPTTPTDIRAVWQQAGTGFGFVVGNMANYTTAPTAASSDTTHITTATLNSSTVYLQARYVDSTRAITGWFSYDGRHFFKIGSGSTTASADPAYFGVFWRDVPACVVSWIRARTDAAMNEAGE